MIQQFAIPLNFSARNDKHTLCSKRNLTELPIQISMVSLLPKIAIQSLRGIFTTFVMARILPSLTSYTLLYKFYFKSRVYTSFLISA